MSQVQNLLIVDGVNMGCAPESVVKKISHLRGIEVTRKELSDAEIELQKAESRKQKAESRKQKAESRNSQLSLLPDDFRPVAKNSLSR